MCLLSVICSDFSTLFAFFPTYALNLVFLKMEAQNSEDENVTVPTTNKLKPSAGRKACKGVTCGFSDAESSSKDAKERSVSIKKLSIVVTLCIVFMSVEVIGGIKANSLAILTDAAHLLSDVAAFAISLFSLWAAGWEATPRQSYGFYRIEILGALVSIQLIWLLAGILVYEAIVRLIHHKGEVHGSLMVLVSAFGLLVNVIMALLLGHNHGHGHGHGHSQSHSHDHDHNHRHNHGHGDHVVTITKLNNLDQPDSNHNEDHATHTVNPSKPLLNDITEGEATESEVGHRKKLRNLNMQGAYLHVLGDSIQSIGVMIGGAIIWYKPEWKIIDLICTLIFSVIVLGTTINMLRNIIEVLMESTPREIDATKLEKGLLEMEEVVAVHELHIWAITVGKVLLSCHVKIGQEADPDLALDNVVGYIKREYSISHVTIQIERDE